MKTKVTLILSFLTILMALGLVYQGQVDGLTSTPAARANTDRAWAFPTPAAGRNAEIVIEVKDLTTSVPQVRNIVRKGLHKLRARQQRPLFDPD